MGGWGRLGFAISVLWTAICVLVVVVDFPRRADVEDQSRLIWHPVDPVAQIIVRTTPSLSVRSNLWNAFHSSGNKADLAAKLEGFALSADIQTQLLARKGTYGPADLDPLPPVGSEVSADWFAQFEDARPDPFAPYRVTEPPTPYISTDPNAGVSLGTDYEALAAKFGGVVAVAGKLPIALYTADQPTAHDLDAIALRSELPERGRPLRAETDYANAIAAVVIERRRKYLANFAPLWLVPIASLYALAFAMRWVYRGFRPSS